jgi:hypothetical protein
MVGQHTIVVSVEVRLFRSKPSFLAQFASDFQPIQWNYVKKPDFFLAPRFSVELPHGLCVIAQEPGFYDFAGEIEKNASLDSTANIEFFKKNRILIVVFELRIIDFLLR